MSSYFWSQRLVPSGTPLDGVFSDRSARPLQPPFSFTQTVRKGCRREELPSKSPEGRGENLMFHLIEFTVDIEANLEIFPATRAETVSGRRPFSQDAALLQNATGMPWETD
jgi:hypothetical protein